MQTPCRIVYRLRQSSWDKSRIAVGGRETDLQVTHDKSKASSVFTPSFKYLNHHYKVWDLGRPEHAIFRAKNVRPDMLELRQEVARPEYNANLIPDDLIRFGCLISLGFAPTPLEYAASMERLGGDERFMPMELHFWIFSN